MNRKDKKPHKLISVFVAVFVAAVGSIPFIFFKEEIQEVSVAGYLGLLAACFLTNATMFLPASGIAFTVSASMALDPLVCCCIGGLGTGTGELIGFLCGRAGKNIVEQNNILEKVQIYVEKHGMVTVFLFALLPLPMFDFVGMAAGAGKMPIWKYMAACIPGKILKMLVYVFGVQKLYMI